MMGGEAESFREGKWKGQQEGTEGAVGTRGEQETGPWSLQRKMNAGHHREGQRQAKGVKPETLVRARQEL